MTSLSKFKLRLLFILLIMNFSLFSQNYYKKIEQSLIECGIKIYRKSSDFNNRKLIIETDSINSINYLKIQIERINCLIKVSDYEKIDSIIKTKYIGKEILSTSRTNGKYGNLYLYILNNKNGNPYFDKYILKNYRNENILISYNSIMGNNIKNFESLDCMIEKLGK